MSKKSEKRIDAEFRRVDEKTYALADQMVTKLYEILEKADPTVAPQAAVEFLANYLMERDEWLFECMLGSPAAQRLCERANAQVNQHPLHETLN